MTVARITLPTGKPYISCCGEPELPPWQSLQSFMSENFLSKFQVMNLAKKKKVALILYSGRYKVRKIDDYNE